MPASLAPKASVEPLTNGQLVSISERLLTLDEEDYKAFTLLEYKDPTVFPYSFDSLRMSWR